jgi:hypothetical protein
MKRRACLFPNPNHEIKQTRTQHMRNKNPMKFYCKEEIKTKQRYDKKTYPKLVLNIL